MEPRFTHQSVLLHEAVELLQPRPGGIYVDGTLGGGGHTRELLLQSAPTGHVIGVDQDDYSLAYAREWGKPYQGRLDIVKGNFRHLHEHLDLLGIQKVDGILCDLGVSSPQLDEGDRGFSYHHNAPLDMRMDAGQKRSAKDLLQQMGAEELTHIFRTYGEEKWATRVASFIVEKRKIKPIETTGDLVEIIKAAIPVAARRDGPHPARRIFQALRIAVNDELGALQELLAHAPDRLNPGGRIAVITFHSLEDRIVKRFFQLEATSCICPPQLPKCVCNHVARLQTITRKPVVPDDTEIAMNPRSRSAKLRVAERLED